MAADITGMVIVFVATYAVRNSILADAFRLAPLFPWKHYLPLMILLIPVWVGLLFWLDGYSLARDRYLSRGVTISVKTTIAGMVLLAAYLFVSKSVNTSRTFLFLCAVGNGLMIFSLRAIFYFYMKKMGQNIHLAKNLMVVGTRAASEGMIHRIQDHNRFGLNLTDFMELEETDDETQLVNHRFQEVLETIRSSLNIKSTIVDEVVVCLPKAQVLQFEPIRMICGESGVRVSLLSDLFPIQDPQLNVSTLHGLTMVTIDPTSGRELHYAAKRIADL
ncbi:hypothetical protein IH979_03430, partial [Patescibacteria group bacterium]|nr:hypothetical protein [Patescibacteria group bacterium]